MAKKIRVLAAGGHIITTDRLTPEERSLIGAHWNDIQHFLATGDDYRLQQLRQSLVDRDPLGKPRVHGVQLEFDLDAIEAYGASGNDGFDSIYDDGEVW